MSRGQRAASEGLSNRFILTANIEAKDHGREIAHGNGKVVRARLSDALYFWKTDQSDLPDLDQLKASAEKFGLDLKKPLDQRMARLDHLGVTFHAKLGTQGERVERIARLAEELAPIVGADPALARRAAVLAKADLTTEIVGEFPELQGAMGRKYALLQGEHPSVAAAIEEHYKPQGPWRPRADRSGFGGRGAGRQARHAGRLLGDRREADRLEGPLCAETGGAGGDQDCGGE